MNKPVQHKELHEIANEWDKVCQERAEIIINNVDYSLIGVTSPAVIRTVLKYAAPDKRIDIIDVGCGTGYISYELSKLFSNVIGIDVSAKSINIAHELYHSDNLSFQVSATHDYKYSKSFDFCTANMVFMTDPNIAESLNVINRLLNPSGMLVFTITHPCFWPKYWNYEKESWFQYKREIYIESDFSTSLSTIIGKTTHIHRPLERYCNVLHEAGFSIHDIVEPYPITPPPINYSYTYPRFLLFSCKKRD